MFRCCTSFTFVTLISIAAGCSSSRNVTLPSWQQNIEQYVREHGKGDPTILRDVSLADGRKGFAVLGDPIPKDSTDAVGLLLGHRILHGKPAFIYLVGMVEKGSVQDMRLAIVSVDGKQFHWTLSPANPEALQSYRKSKDSLWRQRFPQRQTAPAEYLNFPGQADVFTLDIADDRIKAVHQLSGAAWSVGDDRHG